MRGFLDTWLDAFRKHKLLIYATAIAMRTVIGFLGLALLASALPGPLDDESVWNRHIAPALEPKVTHPTAQSWTR